jgi:hypothetical protein
LLLGFSDCESGYICSLFGGLGTRVSAAKKVCYPERPLLFFFVGDVGKTRRTGLGFRRELYNQAEVNITPQRGAVLAETWQRTLAAIPSFLGRLVYLASLRNANTGFYEHFGLVQRIGTGETDALLRRSHLEIFHEWLCFGLERQKEELEEYFATLDAGKEGIVASWLSLEPYAVWVPAESRDVERKLFLTDLAVVLELIRAECGVASRDPES